MPINIEPVQPATIATSSHNKKAILNLTFLATKCRLVPPPFLYKILDLHLVLAQT